MRNVRYLPTHSWKVALAALLQFTSQSNKNKIHRCVDKNSTCGFLLCHEKMIWQNSIQQIKQHL